MVSYEILSGRKFILCDVYRGFSRARGIFYSGFCSFSGMHPRVLVDGFEIAKRATLQFLEKFKTPVVIGDEPDKEILKMVARTTVRTKVTFWFVLVTYLACLLLLFV